MGVANVDGGVKIGAPSHLIRNLVILVGGMVAVASIWVWQSKARQSDAQKLGGFDAFRAAYADKCGVPDYKAVQPEVVSNAYVDSPALQLAIAKQLTVLEAQGTSACWDVSRELRAIDFYVPKPGSGL
jgi:hypothetical protein